MANWMIYGANGYTGRILAQTAVKHGARPILAGRGASVTGLARELGLEARVFGLDQPDLSGVSLVVHCAGPFSATAAPMIDACLQAGAHYLDITGEIGVFEYAAGRDAEARARGVLLMPGVGFDVVPTDCVAAALKEALPDATELALGFDSRSPLSPGTTKTMIEGLGEGGKVRRDGHIVRVPFAYAVRQIDFGFGPKTAVSIPWGDVSTAFHSTGIPNITCFIPVPPRQVKAMRWMNLMRPVLGLRPLQRWLQSRVKVQGPDETRRAGLRTAVWGEARNARGETVSATIETANGYSLTADAAYAIAAELMAQPPAQGGYSTPSRQLGWRFVETLPGSGKLVIQRRSQ